jgi:FtsZ-interacting cell division protein ZipA
MSFIKKLNATTRFVLFISIFGFMLLNNYLILMFGIILILILIYLFHTNAKDNLETFEGEMNEDKEKFTKKNPLYNVLVTDYEDDVDKKAPNTKYDETQEGMINTSVRNFILDNNKDNKDIGKIFKDVGNTMEFENSMRQFHMNPSTTIPNDQNDFLKYCYNDLYSEKPLTVY